MTDDTFPCVTQNGEMCTVGAPPRFIGKKVTQVGHDLVQRTRSLVLVLQRMKTVLVPRIRSLELVPHTRSE